MKEKLSGIGSRIGRDIRQYGAGILAAVILYFLFHFLFDAFCPSVLISGFPCPGCGMTRAILYLLKGQPGRAWALNPAAPVWALWGLLWVYDRYVRGGRSKVLRRAFWGVLVFMAVAYGIRMKCYFPDRPPYVYTGDNLFARLLPGYDKVVRHLFVK